MQSPSFFWRRALGIFSGIGLVAMPLATCHAQAASEEFVHQGRAVFEEQARTEFPRQFPGIWAPDRALCRTPRALSVLRIGRASIAEAEAGIKLRAIHLNPGQAPNYDHAIARVTKSADGSKTDDTLILDLGDGNRRLAVREPDEDDAQARIYRRCP